MHRSTSFWLLTLGLLAGACKGGSSTAGGDGNGNPYNPNGQFNVEGINIQEGQIWELNRPIRLTFNHPVDPLSINFSTIQIRALDADALGRPVVGTFELPEGEDNRVVIFRPACPTNADSSNGAFLPGGYRYEVALPLEGQSGTGTLRDSKGRGLKVGLRRSFQTPRPPTEPLFLDLTPGAPGLASVDFPSGLNLFTQPDPVIAIRFNQSIDGRAENLNTDRLFIQYSAGVIGSGQEDVFPDSNLLPGSLTLVENCGETGAVVNFVVSGIIPPNRKLRLTMTDDFRDLVGQQNIESTLWTPFVTPSLSDVYQDPTWNEADLTVDEFRDDFDTSAHLDLDASVPLPYGNVGEGYVAASFNFPGTATQKDFLVTSPFREIFTDSTQPFTDDGGQQHYLNGGVLNCRDFTLAAGAVLRARGTNPLIIYAIGQVTIDGTLNVSGNNAKWPSSLQSPQFPEGGAAGECGGGRGGDTSWVGIAETPRGESGDGPFGLTNAGGQGGEGTYGDGSFSGTDSSSYTHELAAGGGGGGGFARTLNESIYWTKWPTTTEFKPTGMDDAGPDANSRHPQVQVVWNPDPNSPIYGAEDGMRGSSADNDTPLSNLSATGGFGIEDRERDTNAVEDTIAPSNLDPAWTTGTVPPFSYGNPTNGPDPGRGGDSVFVRDGDLKNDFWGRRLNTDGTVTVGELLTPWAGSGGGGGGDSCAVNRPNLDGVGGADPITNFLPLSVFQLVSANSTQIGWVKYRKGAGGGGGGGQLQIWAIGKIKLGAASAIQANGGVGYTGESVIYTDNGVSGSGGGSGGHVILHTATGMDFSAFSVGTASNASQFGNLTPVDPVQAFGGRRGWAVANDSPKLPGTTTDDGNNTFMIGRGGAGANGVIQIHVPNPLTDITWPSAAANGIKAYIGNPVDTDKLEEAYALFTAPTAYALIPFAAAASMVQSQWIDTGLAGLRSSPDGTLGNWTFPDYANALHKFLGTQPNGLVSTSGQKTVVQPEIATGSIFDVTFDPFEVIVPDADGTFSALFLRNPALLVGFDVYPKAAGTAAFQIVGASYDRASDVLRMQTRVSDTPMQFALDVNSPTWSVRQKFLRVETSGLRDGLPSSTSIRLEFQGADESAAGSNEPGAPFPSATGWTPNLTSLLGYRFIRYRVTFDADAQSDGIDLNSPLPLMDYLKLPFVW